MSHLSGSYAHTLDDRGRIAVPAKLRPKLGDLVWVMVWEKHVRLFPEADWDREVDRILQIPAWSAEGSEMRLAVFSGAADLEVDKQGRILIPANLREAVSIQSEIMIIGAGDHVEIWNKEAWENERKNLDPKKWFPQDGIGRSKVST